MAERFDHRPTTGFEALGVTRVVGEVTAEHALVDRVLEVAAEAEWEHSALVVGRVKFAAAAKRLFRVWPRRVNRAVS